MAWGARFSQQRSGDLLGPAIDWRASLPVSHREKCQNIRLVRSTIKVRMLLGLLVIGLLCSCTATDTGRKRNRTPSLKHNPRRQRRYGRVITSLLNDRRYDSTLGRCESNGQFAGTIKEIAFGTASYRTVEKRNGSPSRLTGIASSGWNSTQLV